MFSLVTFLFFKGSDSDDTEELVGDDGADPHDDVEDLGSGSEVSSACLLGYLLVFAYRTSNYFSLIL
jgi:hypothetical protein